MEDYSDVTVIVPTFNEGDNIGELLDLLITLYPKISVVVSDDGSKDNTQKIVKKYSKKTEKIKLIDRGNEQIHGLTISVLDGAIAAKTEFLAVIDGDLQHPPEKIKEIVDKLREGNEIVVGTREKVLSDWPWHRKLISLGAKKLGQLRLFLGRAPMVNDVVSGFFGTKTELFKQMIFEHKNRFELQGYKVLFDYVKLLPLKTKTAEVMYEFGLRTKGESKIRMKHIILYFKSLFK